MQFRLSILTLLVIGAVQIATAQDRAKDLMKLKVDVVYLASDYCEGRESGTSGEDKAAEYITMRMAELGLEPKGTELWLQPFDFSFRPNPHSPAGDERVGKNVIGYLDNGSKSTVIIGAHYDHLGHGSFGSRNLKADQSIHNGADDNASGIASLLALAKHLKSSEYKSNNYLFIAFSGEELGLYGSKYFVENPTIDLASVNYMLNMDMVGMLNEEGVLAINGAGTSSIWKEIFPKIKQTGIKDIVTTDGGIGPSDHTSFYLNNIPAIHFFTGQHKHYHKPGDDSHNINFEGLYEVSAYIYQVIAYLDDRDKIPFTKTKDENKDKEVSAFKVTLGVMPDYVFNGTGLKIDGVMEDRPAFKAGLQAKDIVLQMGEHKIKDIYAYMEALSKFESGQSTTIIVKRGEKAMKMKVTF